MGIEPTLSAWEAEVLPLNYARETDTTMATSAATKNSTTGMTARLVQHLRRAPARVIWRAHGVAAAIIACELRGDNASGNDSGILPASQFRMRQTMRKLAVLMLSAASLGAQAEVGMTVMASYRFGDDLAVQERTVSVDEGNALALSLHYFNAADSAFDLWLSRFRSDLTSSSESTEVLQESIQFGGRKYWQDQPFLPYVGATIGVLRLSPDLTANERETRPAYTLFVGLALPLTDHVQLLAEARWLNTVFSSDTRIRCDDSDCSWTIKSGTWSQYDIGLGISAQF